MTDGLLLAFDTSSAAVTAALHDGHRVLAERTQIDPLRHGELLAPVVDEVLSAAGASVSDLAALGVGVGPGPFTGLRVGVVTARTMSAALALPVSGVCSLDVIAAAARLDEPFLVASDARRKEVYWAEYDASGVRVSGPAVGVPTSLPNDRPVAGRGAFLYRGHFARAVAPEYPSAAVLADVITEQAVDLLPAVPLYLRRPDISPPARPKSVL